MKITIMRHRGTYIPLIPLPKIIRVRGVVNSTSLVIIWLWLGIDIEFWSS